MANQVNLSAKLTGTLKEIAGVIGVEATLKLAAARGGTRVFIPSTIKENHWLSKLLGFDCAAKLADHFSVTSFSKTETHMTKRGASIEIPIGPRKTPVIPAGVSSAAAALTLGIHQRTVFRRRKKQRAREILAGKAN
jgi:hypothetical protein